MGKATKTKNYVYTKEKGKNIIICLWKIKQGINPNSINIVFKEHLRSKAIKAVLKPLPKGTGRVVTVYEESFEIRSAKLWNSLPAETTHLNNFISFKSSLNKFLSKLPDQPPVPGYYHNSSNSIVEQCLCLNQNSLS